MDAEAPVPRATYRLQFNAGFGFARAASLAPYLARLGVSHVYASPYLEARRGSTHGYDVVDHRRLNPELGDGEDFERMLAAFAAEGLSQVLDVVPNHMGIGADNPWWSNVLEWGAFSDFSTWFDIDWDPDAPQQKGRVLVPVLAGQYGAVLAEGGIVLTFEAERGEFAVVAHGAHRLPIDPNDYGRILAADHPDLDRIGDAFANIRAAHPHQRRRAAELKADLAAVVRDDRLAAAAVDAAVRAFAGVPGRPETYARLHGLLERQHWRLAHFRVAADDINYRRFFNINDLAGLRVEREDVFEAAHALVFDLVARGAVEGLRVDHVDGLLDPRDYCRALRDRAPRPVWIVVEKILAPHERLRSDWGVDGTTGYEVANLLTGLLMDGAGEGPLEAFYREFTGERRPFEEIVREAKIAIIENEMASELDVLARDAARIAASNPMTMDFTRHGLRRALKAVVADFPVYRTYVGGPGMQAADRRDLDWAFARAMRAAPELDPSVFDFLYGLMTCEAVARPGSGFSRHEVIRFAMRVQQYSGPVMAKGVEDTAFYRYNRLLAANEVGGHPARLGVSVAAFHEENQRRLAETPHAMLSTSTHDTKRGEDARARLAALTEMPEAFADAVRAWSRLARAAESGAGDPAPPDRNDEMMIWQMILGAWPPGLATSDAEGMADFRERLSGAVLKALREAKRHTTWIAPDADYEGAALAFLDRVLDGSRANPVLDGLVPFKDRLAALGRHNSLVQTVLKLTVPGVPDIYRGADLWDFSLVDPDNRRPVDFAARSALLEEIGDRPFTALLDREDGAQKLTAIARLLGLRRRDPALFAAGSYEPVAVADDPRVIAFLRRLDGRTLFVAARRFPADGAPVSARIKLPPAEAGWLDVLDNAPTADPDPAAALARAPATVLVARPARDGR